MRPLHTDGWFFEQVLRSGARRWVLTSGDEALRTALADHPRIVFALNHGPPHAPLLPLAALFVALVARGAGPRRVVGVTFRALYAIPGLAQAVRWLTQLDAPPRFDELLAGLRAGRFDDVVLMPEGHHCAFGDPSIPQPPASPRFVELALRADAALVLVAHHGTEAWARAVPAPRALLRARFPHRLSKGIGAALVREGRLVMPVGLAPIPCLRLAAEPFRLGLSRAAFEALPADAQRAFVEAEAERAWARLRAMHATLAAQSGDPASDTEPSAAATREL